MVLMLPALVSAQNYEGVRIIPKLEHSSILIGEQVELSIRVVYPRDQVVRLVLPQDTLVTGVEILKSNLADSTIINDRLQEMLYKVTLTSFDSATYQLNNISAQVGDSIFTCYEPISLVVNTIPVDIDHPEQYNDIKAQWKPQFVWQDYLIYLYVLLGIALLAFAIWRLVKRLKRHEREKDDEPQNIPQLDPYQEAIQNIDELKQKELWEHNQTKEYYTQMTDILRRYIWRVYGLDTHDKTSSEILSEFKTRIGKERMYDELVKILRTADLAKFAKYQPGPDDNINLLTASVAFIEEHKPSEDSEKTEKGGAK